MKTILDKSTRTEIISRIDALRPNTQPLWGKMTVGQMVRHCTRCEEYYFGKVSVKRSFLGRIVGRTAINSILGNEDAPFRKNTPTPPAFKITEPVQDLDGEKASWKAWIEKYTDYPYDHFDHWFFGRLTSQQMGQFIYRHTDHHLRQFGA
jgi:hypothetical protein